MSYSLTSVGVSNFHTATYNGDAASVQPDAPSHESQVTTDSMPMLGISMVGIDEFIGRCGGEACLEGLETAQVCEKFIVPMTIESKSSYVEYIDGCAARRRVPCLQLVSRANLFISHAWRYKFLAVVSALRQFLASNKNKQGTPETVYVWFDLFTNSQHESTCVIRPFSWWSGTFLNAIKSIGWLLLVLEPSDNPVIFTRVWCIWELYCAYVSGCRIDAGMSEAELGRFHKRILLDSQSCDWDFDQERSSFLAMVAHIDIRAADAMRPSDKAQIFAVIEGTIGFHALNSTVTDCLRQWVIADFQRTMESIDSSSGTNCELYEEQKQDQKNVLDVSCRNRMPVDASMLHYKQALANLYKQVGNYNAAVELLEKCQRGYERHEVENIEDVARVMACRLSLAECYCMLGHPRRAAKLLKSVNIDSGVTLGGSLLLHCLVRTADPAYLAEAERLAISTVQDQLGRKALRDWAELPALTSVPAIHSCIQLAEVHVAQGRVDDAQSVLTHVLASAEGVFRDSVDVSVNLIESFYPWPSDKCESSKLALPVAARCIRPCIVRAIHLLAHVSMTKKDFRQAVALNGFIAELCREKFGGNHPDTLTAVSNLAVSYFCLGLDMKSEDVTSLDARNVFEQAEELLRLCHARRAAVFGPAHAICLSTLNNVAVVVRHLGRLNDAEDLLMEALQARPRAEGKYPVAGSVDVDHLICRYNWTAVRLRNVDLRVQHRKNRPTDSRVLEDCTADLRSILQDFMMLLSASHPAILQMKSQLACVLVLRTATRKEGSELFADLLRSLEAAATDSTKTAQSGEAMHISGTVQSLGTKTTLIPPFLTQSWSSDTRCLSSSCLLMDTEISRTETRLVEGACALRLTVTCLQSGDIGLLAPCADRLFQLVKSTATMCFVRPDCRTSQIVVMAALVGAIAFDRLKNYSQAAAILQAGLSYIEAMPSSFNHASSGRHCCIYARFVILLELVRLHFMMGNIGHAVVEDYWAALAAISTNETSLLAESSVTQQYRALIRHHASVKESQQPLERVRSVSRAISTCWLQSTPFVSVVGGSVDAEDRAIQQVSGCCCMGAAAPASNVDVNFLSRHVDLGSVFRFWEEEAQFIVDNRDCAETKSLYLRSHGITDGSPPRGGSCCRLLSCCVCCCPCVLSCWVLLWHARVSVGLSGPHAAIEPS
jgi:tetratricopeptide (TPR) repeat protein